MGLGDPFRSSLVVNVLTRQALIEREPPLAMTSSGGVRLRTGEDIALTAFGHDFLRACQFADAGE
jgi:hypothetical protein